MPNRTLRDTVKKSHKLNAVSDGAQALWFRLLTCVDDYGRFDADPTLIASACYPLRLHANVSKISAQLKELSDIELVVLYTVKSDKYLFFTNWDAGNIRAKKSKYPEPANICTQMHADVSGCEQAQTIVSDEVQETTPSSPSCGSPSSPSPHSPSTSPPLISPPSSSERSVILQSPEEITRKFSENEDVRVEVREFIKHRQRIGDAMTPHALDLILRKVSRLASSDAMKIAVLQQSIERGWAGVFELKADTRSQTTDTNFSNQNTYTKDQFDGMYTDIFNLKDL
jgi:hypothetical protein